MDNGRGEKTVVIHTDNFLKNEFFKVKRLVALQENLRRLLTEAENTGKRIVRMDRSSPDEIGEADVYIVGDDISSKEALRVINPGDVINLAGLYEDVCLAMVFREAKSIGAHPTILEDMTIDMSGDWGE